MRLISMAIIFGLVGCEQVDKQYMSATAETSLGVTNLSFEQVEVDSGRSDKYGLVEIPIYLTENNDPYIIGWVNGMVDVWFVLETGASTVFVK